MNKLEENRAVIDRVDQELTKLFEERFRAVLEIAEYKKENGMKIFDPSREEAIIEKHSGNVPEEFRPYFRSWYKEMLKLSKEYQKEKIGEETPEK